MDIWIVLVLSGLVAGFLAGLLGIGGGFIVVPVLLLVLPKFGIALAETPHFAIGTSLLCICITALFSSRAHHKKQAVDWRLFGVISPGLILGALLGSAIASMLAGKLLLLIFVTGALSTAIYLLSNHQPKPHTNQASWTFMVYGGFTGIISALIGIGGGSLLVPFLVYQGKAVVKAVGTAAACGFPIALFGALGYAYSGWGQALEVKYTSGYLYWPAFFAIVIFSSLSAPLGAKVAHFVSGKNLKRIFAGFLFFTSAQILYSQWYKF